MAATLSMTSEASFPKLLKAGDNEKDMARALRGMTFSISRRTWQVVADGEEDGAQYVIAPPIDPNLNASAYSLATPYSAPGYGKPMDPYATR